MNGVWRKSEVAFLGFSAALDMADEASERTVSDVCFAFSRARAAGILKVWEAVAVVDMVVSHTYGLWYVKYGKGYEGYMAMRWNEEQAETSKV